MGNISTKQRRQKSDSGLERDTVLLDNVSSEQFQTNFLIVLFQNIAPVAYTTSFQDSVTFPRFKKDK